MSRNKHNLSSYNLTTANMGELIPIGCIEALPADVFQGNTSLLIRLGAMNSPVMHPVTARVHHFFVPSRTIIKRMADADTPLTTIKWNDFITGGDDGLNADTIPTMSSTATAGDLQDKLGIPRVAGCNINAMPVAGINMIFNDYYRDQDLVTERLLNDLTIPKISWEKDYFSTARPWSQKGAEVSMPLGSSAPINYDGAAGDISAYDTTNTAYRKLGAGSTYLAGSGAAGTEANALYADLSAATGASILDLRRSIGIQRMAEARAMYGNRLVEYLASEFGSRPQDFRLQRPEYLGGGKTQINFSEILQTTPDSTSGTSDASGVGDLYGHGIGAMRSNRYRRTIPEHGYVITMLSLRPKAVYMDGIDRMFLRSTKEDFYTPQLEGIGQQQIYDNEVYADSANTSSDVFGYSDRYEEYRNQKSTICGDFRSTLNYWHLARDFSSAPTLNSSFVECEPSERIFQQTTADNLLIMAQHKVVARRVVAKNGKAKIL